MEASELVEPPTDAAISALWYALASPGSPVLAKTEVAVQWQVLADSDSAGAVVFSRFADAVAKGAAIAEAAGGDDESEVVDYESQEVQELLALCAEREMVNLPPMKRLIIEELRFYDEHGRQGKRNRGTRKLE